MRVQVGLLALLFLGVGCDVEEIGEAGVGGPYPGQKRQCVVDDDCFSGEVCFAGECIFQRVDTPPPPLPSPEPDALPEEEEVGIAAFTRPAAGVEYVFVARPAADSVVRIHGETLALDAIEVGGEPSVVRIIPDTDRAVVLNRGSDELTIIDENAERRFVALGGHFNAMDLTPDGRHALCWFDLAQARSGELVGSFQDLLVVDIDTGTRHAVTIGFRPRRIQFTADGATALVITDDGISYFRPADLGETTLADTVPVAPDVFQQDDREVLVTQDGRWAISRGPNEAGVTLVDLAEAVPRFIPLPGQPTDLDLVPDDSAVLVMMRGVRQLAIVPLEAAYEDPAAIHPVEFPEHVLGSAAVGVDFAVLYTTQTETRAQISLLDLATLRMVHRPIRKAVAGVEISPDGRKAIIVHKPYDIASGEPDPTEPEPNAPNAGDADASVVDAGAADAGAVDAGAADAGAADAGAADAGAADAGAADAGAVDAGAVDAGETDAGAPDAGEVDAGETDAGAADAGEPDGALPDAALADAESPAPQPRPMPEPDDDEAFLRNSEGYSVLDIRTGRVKLQTTAAPPSGLIFAPERDEAYLLLRGDGVAAVQRIDLNGFAVQSWTLGTPPEVIGVLSNIERAFVTQTHPEGRISFIRLDAEPGDGGRLETVSGYALNGRID